MSGVVLIILIPLAFIPAIVAHNKGYSFGLFYLFGFFFFLPALIVSLVIENKAEAADREQQLRNELYRLKADMTCLSAGTADGSDPSGAQTHLSLIDPACHKCGHENMEGAEYCTKCGEALEKIKIPEKSVCPKCRATVNDGDEFCGKCGRNLKEAEPGAVLVTADNGQVICPVCKAAQMANRSNCYKCGTKFEYC